MNKSKRGFIRKLVLNKIIAKKGLSERVFRGFKPKRQRNVVPIIFSNDSWTEFAYIDSIEIEAEVLKLRRSCGIIMLLRYLSLIHI